MTHRFVYDLRDILYLYVIGCGGTGCSVGAGLPYLDQAIRARGGRGLHVTFIDGDLVSPQNCVRQPFSMDEVGQSKATLLANRLNAMWRSRWSSIPEYLTPQLNRELEHHFSYQRSLVIGCVDKRSARRAIADFVVEKRILYWLDFGNDRETGQYILGQSFQKQPRRRRNEPPANIRLPMPSKLYPALVAAELDVDEPSCSSLEAIERQQPFVNQTLAALGLNLLSQLVWGGEISYHGGFINLKTGQMRRLPIDPEAWKKILKHQKRAAAAVA